MYIGSKYVSLGDSLSYNDFLLPHVLGEKNENRMKENWPSFEVYCTIMLFMYTIELV